MKFSISKRPIPTLANRICAPVMGVDLWGASRLCKATPSRRAIYQLTTSVQQARLEGNCGRVTDSEKEACECMSKPQVCRLPSVRHPHRSAFAPKLRG